MNPQPSTDHPVPPSTTPYEHKYKPWYEHTEQLQVHTLLARVNFSKGHRMTLYRRVCKFLDALYTGGGVLASLFLIAILVLIVIQMLARWTGLVFSGAPNYAGYCMAAASFLAFAHALNRGAHIRVSIVLNALNKGRYWLELWCFTLGAMAATYLAWYAVKATMWSHKFHDISQGQDATPLWIPQLGMSIGAVLLAICFWDNLLRLVVLKQHAIRSDVVASH